MSIAVATLFAVLFVSASAGKGGSGAKGGNGNGNGFTQTNFGNTGLIGGIAQGSGHVTFNNKNGDAPANNNFNHIGSLVNNNPQDSHQSFNSFANEAKNKGFTSSQLNQFESNAHNNLNNGHIISAAVAGVDSSLVSIKPTSAWYSETYISPYTYIDFYSHHVAHIYITQTCPPPPSSIEVCLSTIFDSMEKYLKVVESSLIKHEVSIHNNMHHEHSLLTSEISWAASVNRIAYQVKKAVHVDEEGLSVEISQLIEQKDVIYELYEELIYQLQEIEDDVSANIFQINYIKQEYNYVKTAKWQLYGYISAIGYEKGAVNIAINEIEQVVSTLNYQITKIYNKITQLNKRQTWLVNWENKLYVDLEAFSKDVARFRAVQTNLYTREIDLYAQQNRLKQEAIYAKAAIEKLKEQYHSIQVYLNYLEVYESEIYAIYESVYADAKYFISAYEIFTCQDSLLYAEACSSSAPAAAPAAAKPAAAKPAAAAAKPAAAAAKPAAAAAAPAAKPAAAKPDAKPADKAAKPKAAAKPAAKPADKKN